MKRKVFMAVLATGILYSCCKEMGLSPSTEETAEGIGCGVLALTIGDGPVGTKDAPEHPDWEKAVGKLEVLVFGSSGEIYRYACFTEDLLSSGRVTLPNLNVGSYRLAVIANASEDMNLKTLRDIGELYVGRRFSLADCRYGNRLVMVTSPEFSEGEVAVSEGDTTEVPVVLERPVARVSLSCITNSLPTTITIENVMLTNVADSISPDWTNISWQNRQGRADSGVRIASHIIDGDDFPASAPDFTFRKVGKNVPADSSLKDVSCLYGFVNGSANEPAGFTAEFPSSGEKTCLVVTASIAGRKNYYPIVLGEMKGNTSYDFRLTVTGRGSDDPNVPVKTGSVSYAVTMTEWDLSHSYNDEI